MELIKTDANGNIISSRVVSYHDIYVNSNEIIPKGIEKGRHALIIDKIDFAICDGNDTWYLLKTGGEVISAKAGQPWSALFG